MNRKNIPWILPLLVMVLAGLVIAADPETVKIMPFVSSSQDCVKCHSASEVQQWSNDTANACDAHCMTCHKAMGSHHTVGVNVQGNLPESMGPLTRGSKLRCVTCHNLSRNRFDEAPWRSESLYESIFQRKNQYKTYYLVMKNTKGQLCNTCH